MGRKTKIPLEHKLAELLALRGTLSLKTAMHSTGVVLPEPKGGTLLCSHGMGTAEDGRCLGCKREADQRLYQKRKYVKVMAALVENGVAEAAGKGLWKYAGPAVQPARVRPRLPAEPGRVVTAERAADPGPHSASASARVRARVGHRLSGHEDCAFCRSVEDQARIAHADPTSMAYEYVTDGERAPGHENCRLCDELSDRLYDERERAADERNERRRVHARAMEAGHRYAYQADGRRILRDGSLCECAGCDDRVARRRPRTTHVTMEAPLASGYRGLYETICVATPMPSMYVQSVTGYDSGYVSGTPWTWQTIDSSGSMNTAGTAETVDEARLVSREEEGTP